MTPDAIERLVSETLEPFETLPIDPDLDLGEWLYSPLNCWRTLLGDWQPAPWLTDDRYAMRLAAEMPYARISKYDGIPGLPETWTAEYCVDDIHYSARDKDRRRAIVRAYCKWKGVPIE